MSLAPKHTLTEQKTEAQKTGLGLSDKAGLMMLSGGVSTFFTFLLGVALARYLTKFELGTYKQVFLVYQILSPIFLLGLPASLLYFIPRLTTDDERRQLVGQTVLALLVLGFIFAFAILATAGPLSVFFKNARLVHLLILFSIMPLFAMPAGVLSSLLMAYDRYRMLAISSVLFSLLNTLGVLVLAYFGAPLSWLIAVTAAAAGVQFLVSMILMRYVVGTLKLRFNWALLKKQISYSVPLGLSGVMGLLAYQTDRLVVSAIFDPALFAVYVIGAVEVPFVSTLSSSINAVLVPRFAQLHVENAHQEIADIWRSAIRKTAMLVFPGFVFLFVFSGAFITFLYSDKYAESVPIFMIYLLLMPLRVATYGLVLQAIGKTGPILRGAIYYLVVNLILNLVLAYGMGLAGPAVATVVATVLVAMYYLWHVTKELELRWQRFFPAPQLFAIICLSVVTGALVSPIKSMVSAKALQLILGGLAYGAVFLGLGYVTGVLTKDDRKLIRKWLLLRPVMEVS